MRERIGLFGGTFNPIHFGHLNLALELKEKRDLNQIWLIPSLISPLRMDEPMISPHHRLKMLELATSDMVGFKVCTLELRRAAPSFTIDTVKEILSNYPENDFFLLFGEDSLIRFREWKEPFEIIRQISLLIGSRSHSDLLQHLPTLGFNEEIASAIRKGIVPTRQLEISATEIRERIKKNLYCGHFLPSKVLDYIYENQLYSNSPFVKI